MKTTDFYILEQSMDGLSLHAGGRREHLNALKKALQQLRQGWRKEKRVGSTQKSAELREQLRRLKKESRRNNY